MQYLHKLKTKSVYIVISMYDIYSTSVLQNYLLQCRHLCMCIL